MEIEELHELLKTAHVTMNKLNDRLSSLEEQVKQLQNTDTTQQPLPTCQEALSTHSQPQGTLLLGDSSLITVRAFDLNNQCSVCTVKDANIDLISCWITEMLQWIPKYCILYCGLRDILDGSSPTDIFDKLGSLFASLKQVNDSMDIHIPVCELAIVMGVEEFDGNINRFNNQLSTWSIDNGVSIIKTNLQFRLGAGLESTICAFLITMKTRGISLIDMV